MDEVFQLEALFSSSREFVDHGVSLSELYACTGYAQVTHTGFVQRLRNMSLMNGSNHTECNLSATSLESETQTM